MQVSPVRPGAEFVSASADIISERNLCASSRALAGIMYPLSASSGEDRTAAEECTGAYTIKMLRKCYADSFFFFHFGKGHAIISSKE